MAYIFIVESLRFSEGRRRRLARHLCECGERRSQNANPRNGTWNRRRRNAPIWLIN